MGTRIGSTQRAPLRLCDRQHRHRLRSADRWHRRRRAPRRRRRTGHRIVEPGGAPCTCGGLGHLEGLASGTAIARQARDAVIRGDATAIGDFAREGVITAETVYRAAAHGDALARSLLETAAQRIGRALVNLVALFDPDVIAIGGGVSLAGDLLWAPLRATLDQELEPLAATDVDVVPALLGGDAGLHGAVIVALQAAGAATNPQKGGDRMPGFSTRVVW